MATDWEATFISWKKPSSDTEEQKMDNAVAQIQKAIAGSPLSRFKMRVFPQGSYRNNTNVRLESDVDVGVLNQSFMFYEFKAGEGISEVNAGISGTDYSFKEYKDEVEAALRSYFGASSVRRGTKAFDISESTTRVDADAVPCWDYHWYTRKDVNGRPMYLQPVGTAFIPDGGLMIRNWPEQHAANGIAKNNETLHKFKFAVRILKRLRYYMESQGEPAAKDIPSYLLECLVYNVPNGNFFHTEYMADMRSVLAHTFNATLSDEACKSWVEVNGIKYLFHSSQPWNRVQAHAFLKAAWDFVGFT